MLSSLCAMRPSYDIAVVGVRVTSASPVAGAGRRGLRTLITTSTKLHSRNSRRALAFIEDGGEALLRKALRRGTLGFPGTGGPEGIRASW